MRLLNKNNLNSNGFLKISSSISRINWINNGHSIDDESVDINHINDNINVINKINVFNKNMSSNNYEEK